MKYLINYIKKIFLYIDFKFGRFFFKNDNNFLINLIGHIQLKKKIIDFEDNNESINIHNIGFSKIEPFDKKDLEYFSKIIRDYSVKNSEKIRLDIDINENIIEKINKLLIKNKSLISTLNGYFKSNFLITEINIYRNKYFKKDRDKELINENFHCDHYKKTMIKLFINLSEVQIKNGPLEVFSKKNTKKIILNGFRDRNNYQNAKRILDDNNLKFTNTGLFGDALLCSTTECLHRASIPYKNFHRDMLAITLFKDFSLDFNPIKFKNEINGTLAKKLGKLNLG